MCFPHPFLLTKTGKLPTSAFPSGGMKNITEANIDAWCLPWLQTLLEKSYHIKLPNKAALKTPDYYNY